MVHLLIPSYIVLEVDDRDPFVKVIIPEDRLAVDGVPAFMSQNLGVGQELHILLPRALRSLDDISSLDAPEGFKLFKIVFPARTSKKF